MDNHCDRIYEAEHPYSVLGLNLTELIEQYIGCKKETERRSAVSSKPSLSADRIRKAQAKICTVYLKRSQLPYTLK